MDTTKVINTSGIGLGLVISEKLVNILGGEISLVSEFGKGSTFTFTLKLSRPSESSQISIFQDDTDSISGRASSEEDFIVNGSELVYRWKPERQESDRQSIDIKYVTNVCEEEVKEQFSVPVMFRTTQKLDIFQYFDKPEEVDPYKRV